MAFKAYNQRGRQLAKTWRDNKTSAAVSQSSNGEWLGKAKNIRIQALELGVNVEKTEDQLIKMNRSDLQKFYNLIRQKIFQETGKSVSTR